LCILFSSAEDGRLEEEKPGTIVAEVSDRRWFGWWYAKEKFRTAVLQVSESKLAAMAKAGWAGCGVVADIVKRDDKRAFGGESRVYYPLSSCEPVPHEKPVSLKVREVSRFVLGIEDNWDGVRGLFSRRIEDRARVGSEYDTLQSLSPLIEMARDIIGPRMITSMTACSVSCEIEKRLAAAPCAGGGGAEVRAPSRARARCCHIFSAIVSRYLTSRGGQRRGERGWRRCEGGGARAARARDAGTFLALSYRVI
jgi:hypothetical protein